jgi:hypothetical protein
LQPDHVTNALERLTQYQDPSVLQFNDPGVLAVARKLMAVRDVTLRLAALRAIGDFGNAADRKPPVDGPS